MRPIVITFILLISHSLIGQSMESYDLYYVAVGNAHYAKPVESPHQFGLIDIKGANYSAQFVAEYLEKSGSKYGILLESSEGHYISKTDIVQAIAEISNHMDFESNNERLFVFYYCGHGLGEAVTGRQYLVPGNVVFDTTSLTNHHFDLDELEQDLIYSVDLLPALRKYSDQQLVMLDNCYEEPNDRMVLEHFTRSLGTRLNGFITSLREIHQFRDPNNTVVYTGIPGSQIRPVAPPSFLSDRSYMNLIGRIARKFCIYAEGVQNDEFGADYHSFLAMMGDPVIDPLTKMLKIYSGETYYNKKFLRPKVLKKVDVNRRKGTESNKKVIRTSKKLNRNPIHVMQAVSGDIKIESEQGDWIGSGKNYRLTPSDGEITLVSQGDKLAIRFQELEEYQYFDFEIILPSKYVIDANDEEKGDPDYYWMDHEPIQVSATGRGCSSYKGKFKMHAIERDDKGRISFIHLSFDQHCEDSKSKLTGSIRLNLTEIID